MKLLLCCLTILFLSSCTPDDISHGVIYMPAREIKSSVIQTTDETRSAEDIDIVFVTPSGTKYHYSSDCAGKNATETTLEEAMVTKAPCKKCVK